MLVYRRGPIVAPITRQMVITIDEQHVVRIGVNYKITNCLFMFSCGAVVATY